MTDNFYEIEARRGSVLCGLAYLDFSQERNVRLDNIQSFENRQGIATLLMSYAMAEAEAENKFGLVATFLPRPRNSAVARVAALNFYERLNIKYDETKNADNLLGNVGEISDRCNRILRNRPVMHELRRGF